MYDALTFALKDMVLESGLESEPVSDEIWQGWNYQRAKELLSGCIQNKRNQLKDFST